MTALDMAYDNIDSDYFNRETKMSEQNKSKVTKAEFSKEWTHPQKGTVTYYHDIEFENGDIGQIGAKNKNPDFIAVGQELEYTIEDGQYGKKIKRVQQQQQNSNGGYQGGGRKYDPVFEDWKQRTISSCGLMRDACGLVKEFPTDSGSIRGLLSDIDIIYDHLRARVLGAPAPIAPIESESHEKTKEEARKLVTDLMAKVGEDNFKEIYYGRHGKTYGGSLNNLDPFQLRGLAKVLENYLADEMQEKLNGDHQDEVPEPSDNDDLPF